MLTEWRIFISVVVMRFVHLFFSLVLFKLLFNFVFYFVHLIPGPRLIDVQMVRCRFVLFCFYIVCRSNELSKLLSTNWSQTNHRLSTKLLQPLWSKIGNNAKNLSQRTYTMRASLLPPSWVDTWNVLLCIAWNVAIAILLNKSHFVRFTISNLHLFGFRFSVKV